MKLYQARRCPFAHRVRIVLEEKKLAYEVVYFDPGSRPPELIAVSPDARSPTLFDETNGAVVWDSVVVCEYLDERHPDVPLMPEGPAERARERLLMREVEAKLGLTVGPVEREIVHKPAAERVEAKVQESIAGYRAGLAHWDARLEPGPFLLGAVFTLADVLLYTPLFAMEWVLGKDAEIPETLGRLRAWRAHVGARPSTPYG